MVARQLAFPTGAAGRIVLPVLDRINGGLMDGAVDVLAAQLGERVADIGCGGVRGVRRLVDAVGRSGHVHAVDPSPVVVERMRRRHEADLAAGRMAVDCAPMHDLPLDEAVLDAVLTTNTVYYVDDLAGALAEVRRVVMAGGRLVVGVGDPGFMARLPIAGHGPILRPITTITEELTAASFTVIAHDRLDGSDDAFHVLSARASLEPPGATAPKPW